MADLTTRPRYPFLLSIYKENLRIPSTGPVERRPSLIPGLTQWDRPFRLVVTISCVLFRPCVLMYRYVS